MPPATNQHLEDEQALGEVCNNTRIGAKVYQQCAMHENDFSEEQCDNVAVAGLDFCAEHVGMKLCKASGIQYRFEGNSSRMLFQIPAHPADTNYLWGGPPRTKRAVFCCERCRNLWRDTKQSRERAVEVVKVKNGGRSERYDLINNYCNTGQKVIVDKATSRIVDRPM